MDEIIKILLKKINISGAIVCGILFPGMFNFVNYNFDLFKELDIFKSIILAIILASPGFIICLIGSTLELLITYFLKKDKDKNKLYNKILLYSVICNVIFLIFSKERFSPGFIYNLNYFKECIGTVVAWTLVDLVSEIITFLKNIKRDKIENQTEKILEKKLLKMR